MIVSASWDGALKVWDAATGAEIRTLTVQTSGISSAAFSPDGHMIVSASWDGALKVWNAAAGFCLATFYADAPLETCAWSPHGIDLVVGSGGGGIYWLSWVE